MSAKSKFVCAALFIMSFILLSAGASAQEGGVEKQDGVLNFTEGEVIRVKVPRPSVSYVMGRRRLKFRGLEPKKSFLPAIYESVKRAPF